MDAIASHKWFPLLSSEMWISDPEGINMHNFTDIDARNSNPNEDNYTNSKHSKWTSKSGKRFDRFGNDALNSINFKDSTMLQLMGQETPIVNKERSPQIKNDLELLYFGKIHDWVRQTDAVNKDTFKWWENPAYNNGIMHLSPWWFKSLMLDVYNKTNNRLTDSNAEARRETLAATITRMEWQANWPGWEYILHLVTKKFIEYFKTVFLEKELYYFQYYLKRWDWEKASQRIKQMMWWRSRLWYDKNWITNRGLQSYISFFKKHAWSIADSNRTWLLKNHSVFVDWVTEQDERKTVKAFSYWPYAENKNKKVNKDWPEREYPDDSVDWNFE